VDVQITPEPSDAERAAIVLALEQEERTEDPARSPWWRAGLPDEDEP
jgi:hypothetical protein